jgi:hypothetical protein
VYFCDIQIRYWFELLHAKKVINYYSSNSNHRSSFVASISLHCASIIPLQSSSSDTHTFIISHGGARQTAPIHHVISAPSPSALAFWLDALAAVTDGCLSPAALDTRRRKALLLHSLEDMRHQRPSLQLIGASLSDFSKPTSSSPSLQAASSPALQRAWPQSEQQRSSSSHSSSVPSLFTEEGDGGEAFRECTAKVPPRILALCKNVTI